MILDDILRYRKEQLAREKAKLSEVEADAVARDMTPALDFAGALKQPGLSVIAEVKKASPSQGVITEKFYPVGTAIAYQQAGAAAISVLTEEHYFRGCNDYLRDIRQAVQLPILRKDFVYDPYQVAHARVLGADAVLLIVAMLAPNQLQELLAAAETYGLAALVEVHNLLELEIAVASKARIIGINNRNLKTFEVDFATSESLIVHVPQDCVSVVESGVKGEAEMERARAMGADAVLVGEALMRSENAADTLKKLRKAV